MDDRSSAEHEQSSTRPAGTLRCRACAYDLRGLDPTANCPECGTPVARTLAGDALTHADPEWLRRLSVGLWLDAGATAAHFLLLFPPLVDLAYGPVQPDGSAGVRAWIIFLGVTGLGLAGTWWVTTPEPNVWSEPLGRKLRLALRAGAVLESAYGVFGPDVLLTGQGDGVYRFAEFTRLSLTLAIVTLWWVYVRRILLRATLPGLALAAQFTLTGILLTVVVTQWLPWAMMWLGNWELGGMLYASPTARFADPLFTGVAVIVVALAARALGRCAAHAHPTGQNPVGGSISQAAGSPDRG